MWSFRAMCAWLLFKPSSLKRQRKVDSTRLKLLPLLGRELFVSPQEKGHVALLALPALHGAVQGHAGVSKGKVVQLAVRVVCAAFITLKTETGRGTISTMDIREETTNPRQMCECGAGIQFSLTDSLKPWI